MSKRHFRAQDRYGPRPAKPEGSPLFPHAAGVWAKKIRGKLHYFGPWAGQPAPDFGHAAALERYLAEKDDLHAGRTPREDTAALTVKDLANRFLKAKQARVDTGELAPASWHEYRTFAAELLASTGKRRLVSDLRPDDFATLRDRMAAKWGPHRLKKAIQVVRMLFKFALDAGLIDRPIAFGPGFARPSLKTLRLHRAATGPKLFTVEEVRKLLDEAGTPLRAMILLAINCGCGNTDVGSLPQSALDLERALLDYPRPKTGIPRRCVLWPETVAAVREALAARPTPKDPEHAGLVFLTSRGQPWARPDDPTPVTLEFRKVMRRAGVNGRAGLGFYTLRHTFRTVAGEAKDQPAADCIMGHEAPHMSTHYREGISDERLRAVTDHVRAWLFAEKPAAAAEPEE